MNSWEELNAKFGLSGPAESSDGWEALNKRVLGSVRPPPDTAKAEPVTDFKGNLRLGSLDTGIPLPESVNRRLAQLGSGFADWTLGAKQLLGSATPQDADEKRKIDVGLNADIAGKALNFAGKVLPAMAFPMVGSAPVLSGVAAGAAAGLMEPVGTGDSRGANTALGAAFGGAVPAAISGAKWLAKPSQETLDIGRKAASYGIPVGPGDLATNRVVKAVQSVTNDIPLAGMPGAALREQQQAALNKAVGAEFGAAEVKLTPAIVDSARKTMGAKFDQIWNNNNLVVDNAMFKSLTDLADAAKALPAGQRDNVLSKINDFWSRAQPGPGGAPTVPGETANKFQTFLREQAKPNSALEYEYSSLRKTIIDAFNRSVSPQDAAALTMNRSQWKAFKTVEPLLDKGITGTAGRAEGDIPAALLSEAVRKSYPRLSSQTQAPPLADLAQIASRFMVDRTAQTGGSPRAAIQNMGPLSSLTASFGGALPMNALLNSKRLGSMLLGNSPQMGLLGQSSALLAQRAPIGLLDLFSQPPME